MSAARSVASDQMTLMAGVEAAEGRASSRPPSLRMATPLAVPCSSVLHGGLLPRARTLGDGDCWEEGEQNGTRQDAKQGVAHAEEALKLSGKCQSTTIKKPFE